MCVFKVRDRCTWIRLVRPNLFPQVGVGCFEQLLHLPSQVATHLRGAHAAQRAQGQALDVLCAVVQVTVDERGQVEQVAAVNTDGENGGGGEGMSREPYYRHLPVLK